MTVFRNIVSLGASGRIKRKAEEFEDIKDQYEFLYQELEQKREVVNDAFKKLVAVKVEAVKSLEKISKISKNIKSKDRDFMFREYHGETQVISFSRIEETITAGQAAMSATKGISTGAGTALGAWALVSTFGTASTGTAITGLSGVAATNATLAWLGGGSIAAGGGGIAVGTAVLGGLVVIPAIATYGVFSHLNANKKINNIAKEINEVISFIDQIEANLLKMKLLQARSDELIISVEKARITFEHELKRTLKELNRIVFISRFVRWTRSKIFRSNYYSESDLKKIAYIGGIASDFSVLIDTPVFEEEKEE